MDKSTKLYRVLAAIVAAVCLAILPGCSDQPDRGITVEDISKVWRVTSASPDNTYDESLTFICFGTNYIMLAGQEGIILEGRYTLDVDKVTFKEYIEDELSDTISTIEIKNVDEKYLTFVYDGVTYDCRASSPYATGYPDGDMSDWFYANGKKYKYSQTYYSGFVELGSFSCKDDVINLQVSGINGGVSGFMWEVNDDIVNYNSKITLHLNIDKFDYNASERGDILNLRKDYDAENIPLTYDMAFPPDQDPYEVWFEYNTYHYRISDDNQGKIVFVSSYGYDNSSDRHITCLVLRFKNLTFSRIDNDASTAGQPDSNSSAPENITINGRVKFECYH